MIAAGKQPRKDYHNDAELFFFFVVVVADVCLLSYIIYIINCYRLTVKLLLRERLKVI